MLGDDELNISTAIQLRKNYERLKLKKQPLIYAIVNDYQRHYNLKKADGLYRYDIKPVGRTITRYSEHSIQQKDIERNARIIHTSFMLNNKFSDILATKFTGYLENYVKTTKDSAAENLLDLFKQHDVDYVNNLVNPAYIHNLYRSWQEIIDNNNIGNIDFSDLYETYNLITKIQDKIADCSFTEALAIESYGGKIARKYLLSKRVGNAVIDDILKDISTVVNSWHNEMKDKIKSEEFIGYGDFWDFDKREYYRRSSKSRALFEHILFKMELIKYHKKDHEVTIEKPLLEFMSALRYPDEIWKTIIESPCYAVRWESAIAEKTDAPLDSEEIDAVKLAKACRWFLFNDFMQNRWMVFMWGEGYIHDDNNGAASPENRLAKTHKYLKPHIKICENVNNFFRQTLETIHVNE